MSLETTKTEIRKSALRKVLTIIEDNFECTASESTRVSFFVLSETEAVDLEILLEDEFGFEFDLSQNPSVNDIVDMACQF